MKIVEKSWTMESAFLDLIIKSEKDKIAHNRPGGQDYGLGSNWTFIGGTHIDGIWHTLWGELTSELRDAITPHMCDGIIGHVAIHRWEVDGLLHLIARDKKMIASMSPGTLTDLPSIYEKFL